MEEREEERELKRALMQELAVARAPRQNVRVKCGPYTNKVMYD